MRYSFLDTLAWVEYHLGNYANAQDFLEELELNLPTAGVTDDTACSAFYHLGVVWLKQGDPNKAKQNFQKSVDLKLDSLDSRRAQAALMKFKS